jgi:hypothetical protein
MPPDAPYHYDGARSAQVQGEVAFFIRITADVFGAVQQHHAGTAEHRRPQRVWRQPGCHGEVQGIQGGRRKWISLAAGGLGIRIFAPDPTVQEGHHAAIGAIPRFRAGRGGIGGGEEIDQADAQALEHLVGQVGGQEPVSFQYVMDMGLGNAGDAGQGAFAKFSIAHAGTDVGDEPQLEKPEVHWRKPPPYFYRK